MNHVAVAQVVQMQMLAPGFVEANTRHQREMMPQDSCIDFRTVNTPRDRSLVHAL